MVITLGLSPVSISYAVFPASGGPVVRLRQSTACSTMYGQKPMGAPLASMLARTISSTDRIDLSATPLSWCT